MSWLLFVFAFLITMLVIVGIHEASHFAAAKLVGVKVLRFSIGFGKSLFTFHDKSGTEYVLALLPLGGYVKMLGETDDALNDNNKHQAYSVQPFYKKAFIIAAGPLSNFVCAFLLYTIIYCMGFTTMKPILGNINAPSIAASASLTPYLEITQINGVNTHNWTNVIFQLILHTGEKEKIAIQTKNVCGLAETSSSTCREERAIHQLDLSTWAVDGLRPDPLSSLGIEPYYPYIPLIIGQVIDHSAANNAGFHVNDRLIKLNHEPIQSWNHLAKKIKSVSSHPLLFDIIRDKKPLTLLVSLNASESWLKKKPQLGIAPKAIKIPEAMLLKVHYSPSKALYQSYLQCKELTYFNLVVFKKMLTGKVSLDSLGGPIVIFDTAGQALNQGIVVFLVFLAFMNLSIGLMNLFPIPGLDGGHLFLHGIECIIRRPIPPIVTDYLLRGGVALLLLFFTRALFNDIMRLF